MASCLDVIRTRSCYDVVGIAGQSMSGARRSVTTAENMGNEGR